jgi:hypothetical protein
MKLIPSMQKHVAVYQVIKVSHGMLVNVEHGDHMGTTNQILDHAEVQ